jgi:hypothetical protein
MSNPNRPPTRKRPALPPEEPAVPLEPSVAKARAAYIRSQIDTVKALKNQGKNVEEIREQVREFSQSNPKLFELLTSTEPYNEGSLRTMLAMLDRMGTGEMTQHQASGVVGQRLYDIYVAPKIDAEKERR